MNKFAKYGYLAVIGAGLFISGAHAAGVVHDQPESSAPFADSVAVPSSYTTYYFSGTVGEGADTAQKAAAALTELKAKLANHGMTFGDVVQAHVFLAHNPDNGKVDFAGMNSAWFKEFGTATQPNKPARSTLLVGSLGPNDEVEIELVAVKKGSQ